MRRSIVSVTVMTALNSIIKIDAIDEEGKGVSKFFAAAYDVDTLNDYIAQMIYDEDIHDAPKTVAKKPARKKEVVMENVPPSPAPIPAEAPVTPAPQQVPPVASVPPVPKKTAPARVPVIKRYGVGPSADPEVKALLATWMKTATGGQPIPATHIAFLEGIKAKLLNWSNGEPAPIVIDGEVNVEVKNWFINSVTQAFQAPVGELI